MKEKQRKKRGQSELFPFIMYLVLALIVLISLLFFVNSSAKGIHIKEQVLAKQIALLINYAEPDTEITVPKQGFMISMDGNSITVKAERSTGYSYDFFSKYNVKLETKNDNLIINISE